MIMTVVVHCCDIAVQYKLHYHQRSKLHPGYQLRLTLPCGERVRFTAGR
jgi:hypothetical protein